MSLDLAFVEIALTMVTAINATVVLGIRIVKAMMKTNTCANCLNAYNTPYDSCPHCYNKDFTAQFMAIDVRVKPTETCGTWSLRRKDQAPLVWTNGFQLSLLDELLNS